MADEKPSALKPSAVPRPALFGWSISLIVIAAVVWFVAQVMLADAYGIEEQTNAVALASSAVALEGLGWLLFVASCIIHTIRVEAEATRRGVSVAYGGEFSTAGATLLSGPRSPEGTRGMSAVQQSTNYNGTKITWWENGELAYGFSIQGDRSEYPTLEAVKQAIRSGQATETQENNSEIDGGLTDQMRALGISFDGEHYHYKTYRYTNLADAVSYAQKEQERQK